jgi:hypothetical protein
MFNSQWGETLSKVNSHATSRIPLIIMLHVTGTKITYLAKINTKTLIFAQVISA